MTWKYAYMNKKNLQQRGKSPNCLVGQDLRRSCPRIDIHGVSMHVTQTIWSDGSGSSMKNDRGKIVVKKVTIDLEWIGKKNKRDERNPET